MIVRKKRCHLVVLKNMSTSQRTTDTSKYSLLIETMIENVLWMSEKIKKITYIEMRMIMNGTVLENSNLLLRFRPYESINSIL